MHWKILIMKHCSSEASMIVLFFLYAIQFCCGLYGVDNFLLIPESLHNSLNSFDVNSPPLFDRKVFSFFYVLFSIKSLNSCLPRKIINERNIVYIPAWWTRLHRIAYIGVDDFHDSFCLALATWKCHLCVLSFRTSFANTFMLCLYFWKTFNNFSCKW